jgi:aquaporin Z
VNFNLAEISDLKKYVAELLGTMALVFFGCGSAVIAGDKIGFLGISAAFGVVVLVMVYSIGPISGCHINPAITIAMLVAKKINKKDAIAYIIAQCIGAILGSLILLAIASGKPGYALNVNGLGQNGYDNASPGFYSMGAGFLAEIVLTFFFLLVIFGATSEKANQSFAGVAIGLTLFIVHLVGIPITGTSVNPARSLGPALFAGVTALSQLWLFIVAPIIGAVLAALVWIYFFEKK